MRPLSAFNLQAPSLHRTIASTSLRRLGYTTILEGSSDRLALRQMRRVGGVHLLVCDLRVDPAARLNFLQTVAQEHLAYGVAVIGELVTGTWSTLARLLRLQGLKVLNGGPTTHERMNALLEEFNPLGIDSPSLPLIREIPSDEDVVGALSRDEIKAALQPKISVSTGGITGFEVLARWQREDGEIVLPGCFLPALRRNGLLDALLFTLIDQAICALQSFGDHPFHLAFNVEPVQLSRPGFSAQLAHRLLRQGADPRRITFELTEIGALRMPAISLDNLLRLRLLGCGLAIDDFGSGHSTLERLIELPFTEMKLDAQFLTELDDDPRCGGVLASALALGRALGLTVIAEGVESESHLRHLQLLGYEHVQGYYFCKPLMGSALHHFLRRAARRENIDSRPSREPAPRCPISRAEPHPRAD
ncbi:EAL domain-containing response regulator [Pseudomonas sp. PDNC002]|uniref:EAL domain-containing response regulator n=1 Tax=Pseudomonas sp. PDNC002 TaxID=2811422 RepID=UPI00196603C8|nr:EAL domain-containing response regulator [Pseudomonas sp. PDNC002]QRY77825.1 EAL domain-containing response regulator [Pseudomonas sp. PDNC002]